jgi:DNA-binding MarR family transcriptional regulator
MSASPADVTELVLTVFRLNGRLVEAGNQLVKDLGLTSAWWQVLGALALAPGPLPVSHIARNMGLARQGVQRIVDLLAEDGLVRFAPNPHHRRAKLIVLTERGSAIFEQAMQRQRPWALDLAAGLAPDRIAAALGVLRHFDQRLAAAAEATNED